MRNNWAAVYRGQELILNVCQDIEPLIFAGGTALHRCVLSKERRESEDIDFFVDHLCGSSESSRYAIEMRKAFTAHEQINVINYDFRPEEKSHRFACIVEGSDEVIKVELLDFTGGRFSDESFVKSSLFPRVENSYNLILYKLKALSDRTDTIKDLYDLYFLFREHKAPIDTRTLFFDLEMKFKAATGYDYGAGEILKALSAKHRQWDIIPKNVGDFNTDLISAAIYDFRDELVNAITDPYIEQIDLSHERYVKNKIEALDFDTTVEEYLDVIEANSFVSTLVKESIL
jgi:predicted nucleotidyltransferase component of viral defense system